MKLHKFFVSVSIFIENDDQLLERKEWFTVNKDSRLLSVKRVVHLPLINIYICVGYTNYFP